MKYAYFFTAFAMCACGPYEEAAVPPPRPASSAAPVPPPPVDVTPDAPFRANAPGPSGTLTAQPPKVVERKLSNGIRVLFVERSTLPLCAIRVGLFSGAMDEPTTPPVVATALGTLLEYGTKKFSAEAYAETFDSIGARHSASIGWSSGAVAAEGPTDTFDRVLELVASAVTEPTFPEVEIKHLKEKWRSQLEIQKTNPRWLSWNALGRGILGEKHPMAHPASGRPEEIDGLSRAAVLGLYTRMFVADNIGIAVAGDARPDEMLPKLEARFGKIRRASPPRKSVPIDAPKSKLLFVEKKGATQSQLVAVLGGPTLENDPDREALDVANAIFGGMFSSRLNLNLREQHAYTYGSRSSFFEHRSFALMTAGGAMVREHTTDAILEVKKELARFVEDGATDEEIRDAKEYLRLDLMRPYETVWDTASELGDILFHAKPVNEAELRGERLNRVSREDVKRVARTRFHPTNVAFVVVGDRSVLNEQLTKQPSLGTAEVRDAFGAPEKDSTAPKKAMNEAPKAPEKGTPAKGATPPKK